MHSLLLCLMETVRFCRDNLDLVGWYSHAGEDAVIFCHGFLADKSSKGFLDKAAEACQKKGYSTLQFDFSGCGESDDAEISVAGQIKDLEVAKQYMRDRGHSTLILVGYSLGGLIALKGVDEHVDRVVLWAPVTHPRKGSRKREIRVKRRWRNIMKVSPDFGDEQAAIDPEFLRGIDVPVRIIHGRRDSTVPIEDSRKAVSLLPQAELLEVDARHGLDDEEKVVQLTVDFL